MTTTPLSPAELKALFPNASPQVIEMSAKATANLIPQVPAEERRPNPAERRREVKELHRPFQQWLDLEKLLYIYPRSDKASGIRVGWPDFTVIYRGRVVCVEMKWPGAKLRAEQAEIRNLLFHYDTPWCMATSAEEAIQFVRAELLRPEQPTTT